MLRTLLQGLCWALLAITLVGCATTKESDTARTGIEQLLVSSAVDQALDKIDFTPVRGAKVHLEEKYLDCVDKNYVIVALEQRLLMNGSTLVDKAEDSDVIMHVTSGGVGTDRQEKFVGISEIPLPPPSPIMIPQVSLFSRQRANGTAKLRVVAFDTKSRQPVLQGGVALARSDFKSWKFFGAGPVESGSVPTEIAAATNNADSIAGEAASIAAKKNGTTR
ncbi:MAG: hypothetical protein JNG90_02575 [Planctomycetaceae bacterium]|nr:hypothetical protein [Planctomycetaceae bacterium]